MQKLKFLSIILSAAIVFSAWLTFAKSNGLIRSVDDVFNLIQLNNIKSVEELIPQLDEELRSHYSLIFKSQSPIFASYEMPRVHLFDSAGDIHIAFSSNRDTPTGHIVEIIEYPKDSILPKFGRIEFLKDGTINKIRPSDIEVKKCYGCHTSSMALSLWAPLEAHANWNTYPDWQERYGTAHKPHDGHFAGISMTPPSDFIDAQFLNFKQKARLNPRLNALIGLEEKSLADLADMNSELGSTIMKRNLEKAAAIIRSHPLYDEYSGPLATFTFPAQSDFFRSLRPDDKKLFQAEIQSLKEYILERQKWYYEIKLSQFHNNQFADGSKPSNIWVFTPDSFPTENKYLMNLDSSSSKVEILARLLFLLRRMDISGEIFNLTHEPFSYSTTQARYTIGRDFADILKAAVYSPEINKILREIPKNSCSKALTKQRQ